MNLKNTKIKIRKLFPEAKTPTYGSDFAAGADLYACTDGEVEVIFPGETKMFHTGIAMEIPEGYVGLICARSGIAVKRGLAPANKIGVIDSDYRGEIMVALHNHSKTEGIIDDGERIAQIVIVPYLKAEFTEADVLEDTDRGDGGFGSTGTK